MQDVRRFHQAFYNDTNKLHQDNLILKYTKGQTPKRRRPDAGARTAPKSVATKYFVKRFRKSTGSHDVQVCQKAFLAILDIKRCRVQGVIKRHKAEGGSPKEKRGGDRRTKNYEDRKNAVITFIKRFKPDESHYCRGKSSKKYLSSDLSVRKMWRMYTIEHPQKLHVKYDYFRCIFVTNFNISFNTPATDVCSKCTSYLEKIKVATDPKVKQLLQTEYYVHKLKAKAFYNLLKEKNELVFFLSFDCQKNMILPKVADQSAYYSRQLYSYNFTICQGNSKARQTIDLVSIFNWLEGQFAKASNQIVSCVFHKLCTSDFSNLTMVRIFADGAAGQNKNSSMLYMIAYWLLHFAPAYIESVELIYPVVGHSFLPPDRVFGRIEQVVKKKATIINPDEYREVFSNFGTVLKLGDDVKILDFKQAAKTVLKTTTSFHFKFQQSKRLAFKRNSRSTTVLVKGEVNYRSDLGEFKSICKKTQKFNVAPKEIQKNAFLIKKAKLNDVDKLLKSHFGEAWRDDISLKFYKDLIEQQAHLAESGEAYEDDGEDQYYNPQDDAPELRV